MSDKRDQARSRWMKIFENLYPKYESLFRYGTELVVADAETLKTYGEDGKEYTLQVAPWECGEEQESKLESEKLQLSPETSTKTPTNGTFVRDGRLMHDLVYRGGAEVTDTVEESITIQTGQTYGKSANVVGDPDTDLISRQVAVEALTEDMPSAYTPDGSHPADEGIFMAQEIYADCIRTLKEVPSAQPEKRTDKRTETHGVCSDCISRQAVFYILENKMIDRPLASDRWVIRDIGKAIESLPTVELKPVCEDAISRQAAIEAMAPFDTNHELRDTLESLPPVEDMGEVSDGYHTFNQLYHQRAVLFATIVNQNKDKAWKSWKHEDGKFCFDKEGEWFIVGVDTPEGSYTYHYEKKYWDVFDCEELDKGKHWDGHTEDDVTRLLSLPPVTPTVNTDDVEHIARLIKDAFRSGFKEGERLMRKVRDGADMRGDKE